MFAEMVSRFGGLGAWRAAWHATCEKGYSSVGFGDFFQWGWEICGVF